MAQPFKVEGFVLGFCLLALGGLWTAANFGALDLLRTLRTYWPVSLIVWGLAEILNTFLARGSPMKPRKIALLFLLLGFGAAIETAYSLKTRMAIGPAGCRLLTGKFQGPSFAFESEETKEGLSADLQLEVENAFGEVRVFKGEPGRLKLRVRKVVFAQSEEAARAFAVGISTRAELAGGTLRVTSNRRELEQSNDTGFETHLYIEAPPGTLVKVQNEHGAVNLADVAAAKVWNSYEPVRVERVAGPADVDSRHGDVFAEKIDGALSIFTRHGNVDVRDAAKAATLTVEHGDMMVARVASLKATAQYSDISAEDVAGELVLYGKHASLKASRIKGRATVDTTYRNVTLRTVDMDVRVKTEHGSLTAEALKGALNVETSYDDVEASDVAGPVDVRVVHGGFKGSQLKQGARVNASGDDVEIRGFEGPIEVETQRGGVRLSPDKAIVDGVSVVASRGAIHLEVPIGSRFDLEAAATRGEVQVDLPELTINESSSSRVKAKLGAGGKRVSLRSEHGDITVETRTSAASK